MPIVKLHGIELYYETHGEGPAVVFLHGAAGNHLSWWQQVPVFRERYQCITIDHRGFGRSTDPAGAGGAEYVRDLELLLDELEVDRVSLVAQSMGGRTALGFAVRHPQRVDALVMADTWGFFDWPELQEEVRRLREQAGGQEAPLAERALGQAFQAREPARTFLYRQIAGLNPPRDPANILPPAGAPDRAAVSRLTVPTLFIVGGEDTLTPPAILRRVADIIPGAQFREFPGFGHSVYFEDATGFNAEVERFLGAHVRVPA
ncbi:MAG: alpha/beta fold hydrolase [Chloroflexi bacterium]|nr:alpha/beta fold hydrolase [Chloroflexota bacterium]